MKSAAVIILLFIVSSCTKGKFIQQEGNLVPNTVEQDPTLPALAVNGTVFHAETFGNPQNSMLVILHGGPGSDYRYLLNCKEFASKGYFVIFFDQRGSGLSKRHNKEDFSIQLMIDDLNAVILHYRKSPTQKLFLLGHSWGAILATAYINQIPSKVNGAIFCEPGGFKWTDIEAYVKRARDIRFTSEVLNDAFYLDQFITGKKDQHAILDYKLGLLAAAESSVDNPTGNEALLPFWRAGAVVNKALFELGEKQQPDWTGNLQMFTPPILFVYSERNKAYGLDHARYVSSAYQQVQLQRIDNAGHDFLSFPSGWIQFFPVAFQYLNSL
ncbi:alpha/beta hydrolase [Lacibacter sp. H375]|uniref:alpha/beta hydrolase n=1 Tax=Lacibacter sp. H375 TaxID=3133424 RepID=UPI0030BCF8BD